jgi:hypothetical protein
MLTAIFALSVSAKEWTYKDEAGTTYLTLTINDSSKIVTEYEGRFPMWNEQNQPLTWYVIATDEANGVKTVKSFVSTDPAYTNHGNGYFRFIKSENFNVEGYPVPTRENVVSLNMPNDMGITAFSNYSAEHFHAGTTYTPDAFELLFLRCPNTLVLADNSRLVQSSKVLEVELDKNSTFTVIGYLTFHECRSLRKVNIPASVRAIKSINDNHGRAFNYCVSLETLTFDEGSQLTEIQSGAFNGCDSLREIQLPASMVTINNNTLSYCDGLRIVRLPETFTHFVNLNSDGTVRTDHHSFAYNSDNIKEYYLPVTFYATMPATNYKVSYAFHGGGNVKFFYCGTLEQLNTARDNFKNGTTSYSDNNGNFTNATPVDYKVYSEAIKLDSTAYSNGDYIIYGYNSCDAFHKGVHKFDNDCTTADACANGCGVTATKYDAHNMSEAIEYPNGFASTGILYSGCLNPNCQPLAQTTVPAIFVMNEDNGFATKGDDGIAFGGYCLNATALDEYNRINKDAPVKYGVVLINPDYLDGKDSFFKDGKVNSTTENKGFLQTDMSSARYANISISVTGFTGKAENLSIILAIYAYTDDSDVEFIQSQTTECASKRVTLGETSLYTVTLASVKAGNSTLANLGEYIMPSQKPKV